MTGASSTAARRYARALLALGRKDGDAGVDALAGELRQFDGALAASPELRNVLMTPGVPLDRRLDLLRTLLAKAGASTTATHALLLLTERGRLPLLGDIVTAVRDEADRAAGRLRATVTSAAPLTPAQVDALRTALERRTGQRLAMDAGDIRVDRTLLGGVVAEIGGVVYDGSLKSQLRRLRDDLSRGGAPN